MKDALDLCDVMFTFKGTVNDLPKKAINGDIVMIAGTENAYIYIDGEWVLTGLLYDEGNTKNEDITYTKNRDITYTNCPNCGAPVDKSLDKCPYCNTPYI